MLRKLLRATSSSLDAAGRPLRKLLARSKSERSETITSPPAPAMDPSRDAPFDPVTMADLSSAAQRPDDSSFDIFTWYPQYQSCQRYFVDRAQHSLPVQALSSYLNIQLPFQRQPNPIYDSSTTPTSTPHFPAPASTSDFPPPPNVSLFPYIRRLVATGMDFPGVLHGFFGDDWVAGVGPLHEQERRNYLFAAKSGGWSLVKRDYDMLPQETIPFLSPLQGTAEAEIEAAEKSWSEWLAMEDWMVGPRAPGTLNPSTRSRSRSARS